MTQFAQKKVVAGAIILWIAMGCWVAFAKDAAPLPASIDSGEQAAPPATLSAEVARAMLAEEPQRVPFGAVTEALVREEFWPSGRTRWSGQWSLGQRVGVHRSWHENGQLHSVEHWDGDNGRHGPSICYYSDGSIATEGAYECGYATGLWRAYFEGTLPESRGLYEVVVKNGMIVGQQRVGRWVFWNIDGSINSVRSGLYENGRRVAP